MTLCLPSIHTISLSRLVYCLRSVSCKLSRFSFLAICPRNYNFLFLIVSICFLVDLIFLKTYSLLKSDAILRIHSVALSLFFIGADIVQHSLPYWRLDITLHASILFFLSKDIILCFNTLTNFLKASFTIPKRLRISAIFSVVCDCTTQIV